MSDPSEVIDTWLFNLDLELSGASLSPLEEVVVGGAVLSLYELRDALEAAACALSQNGAQTPQICRNKAGYDHQTERNPRGKLKLLTNTNTAPRV